MDNKQSLKFYITKNRLLEDELISSESIRKAEKEILIKEIEKNKLLETELVDVEKENKSLQENLNDISDTHSNIINEKCWPDEKHCTCVPFLRIEIDKLKKKIKK